MNGWAAFTIVACTVVIVLGWIIVEAARAQSRERVNAHNRGDHQ